MPKIRDIIRTIPGNGWELAAIKGSHRAERYPAKPGKVTIAGKLSTDVPSGTQSGIAQTSRTQEGETTMKYSVFIEKGPTSYGAYAPDLPGCGAAEATRDEVTQLIREAVDFHLEGLRRDGDPVPLPQTTAIEVDVPLTTKVSVPAAV